MFISLLVVGTGLCGFLALRANRLLSSALWLAAASAFTSILLYQLNAYEVAVIELSVGAGLVTVLFVFAIAIAGEDGIRATAVVPKWVSWTLLAGVMLLLGWFVSPLVVFRSETAESIPFSTMLWQNRALDVLVQVGLIFAGVMGVLGLLAEDSEQYSVDSEQYSVGSEPLAVGSEGEEVRV